MSVEEKGGKESLGEKVLDEVLEWVESFVFAIFIVILVFIFIFKTVLVDGSSMTNTLKNEDKLIVSHIKYEPQRGDIVVFYCEGLSKRLIKRCIGLPGDKVTIDYNNNNVKVNDEIVEEDYIINEPMEEKTGFDSSYAVDSGVFEYIVPEDKIFALGDNRNGSTDSRSSLVGFIDKEDLWGKAVFRIFPFDSFGKIG